ncbi:hypothetical protein [Arenimonas sp.]|uniref:hypothetical protein n=1 Tax=Arenimonas sp. TaxID=1872635 RepID=UPI0035AF84D5
MTFFFHRMFSYCPSKPRNPLLKVLVGLLGLALLLVLVGFGLVIGLGMLLFAGARRLFVATRRPAPRADVIEGEYTRVRDPHPPLHLR